jgi:hypothetical protein
MPFCQEGRNAKINQNDDQGKQTPQEGVDSEAYHFD